MCPRRTSPGAARAGRLSISEQEEQKRVTHLDPAPHDGEERRGVDDGDGAERLGVVGGREGGRLLEVRVEGPHRAEGDVLEVDDRRHGRDGRGRVRVREVRAEPEDEARHGLVERHAARGAREHGGARGDGHGSHALVAALRRDRVERLFGRAGEGREAVDVHGEAVLHRGWVSARGRGGATHRGGRTLSRRPVQWG